MSHARRAGLGTADRGTKLPVILVWRLFTRIMHHRAGWLLAWFFAIGAAAQAEITTVAISNTQAPGTPEGVNYSTLDLPPVLNDAGQVAFTGTLTGTGVNSTNDGGAWLGAPGAVQLFARKGSPAPGMPPEVTFFNVPNFPSLNNAGQVAFDAFLSTFEAAIWNGSPGALGLAARQTTPAPGTPPGVNFVGLLRPAINDAGQIAFAGSLAGTDVNPTNNGGIWRGATGSLQLVVREGSAAPGTPAGVIFGFSAITGPSLNDAGQVAFGSALTGTGVDPANDNGIWRGAPGAVQLVTREGNAAPDTAAGVSYSGQFGSPALNDAGQVAFVGFLAGADVDLTNDRGVWRGGPGTLQLVARAGSSAAGTSPGVNFRDFVTPVLNDAGQVAFNGFLIGAGVDGTNDRGIWRGAPANLQLIAREGSAAPSGAGANFLDIFDPALNDAGQVAFGASLTGLNVVGTNDGGIYIGDGEEQIQVVREGQSLAGSTITVANIQAGQDPGGRSSLNAFSQLAFRAELADGRRGIFLFTPEVRWRRSFGGEWDAASNWTLSIPPGNPHDVKIDPAGIMTVLGPTRTATVKSLTVGGGTGIATLSLQQGGSIAATGGVTVKGTGVLSGDGTITGAVTNEGRVMAENVTITGGLTNRGIVTGNGRITAAIVNAAEGEVRVAVGQQLHIAGDGDHTNNGRIEVFGGELEIDDALTNASTGFLAARNAVLRFSGGLSNQGTVGLSFGTSDVVGTVQNLADGKIVVSGGSDVTFYDNVVNNGELRTSAGSTAVYFGNVSGTGTFTGTGTNLFEGTFSPGASPGLVSLEGDVALSQGAAMILEIAGSTPGALHDQVNVGGLFVAAGTLDVRLIDDFQPALGEDFALLSFNELDGWFDSVNLPSLDGGLSWQPALTDGGFRLTVVPEPASLGLCGPGLALAALWFSIHRPRGRRRWSSSAKSRN